jgi:hypothetical protein
MSLHRIAVFAALGLVFAALAAPASLAQQDLRNPDTRDAAESSYGSLNPQTGRPAVAPQPSGDGSGGYQDLRNPDTRGASPEVTVVEVPVASPSAESGLDWGDAGIGAGGMLGLVLLAAGGALAVTHRKGTRQRPATTG